MFDILLFFMLTLHTYALISIGPCQMSEIYPLYGHLHCAYTVVRKDQKRVEYLQVAHYVT